MPTRTTIIYIVAWVLYVLFSTVMFPAWGISVAIPMFLLVGIGAWIFGTTLGLSILAVATFYHMILFSFIYSGELVTYQTKISSPLVLIAITYLFGNLRTSFDNLKATNEHLDDLVDERTQQLNSLTAKLLENSENLKIARGQELHDGMGQQLTGIQLMSSSLSEQLLEERNTIVSWVHHMGKQASRVHHQLRRISRLLFPVRIGQVGLIPALNELVASITEIKPISIKVADMDELSPASEMISLQLYRICQETVLYSIDHLNADEIVIHISESSDDYYLRINHNGSDIKNSYKESPFHLINYRLKQIFGRLKSSTVEKGFCQIDFFIPKQYSFEKEELA